MKDKRFTLDTNILIYSVDRDAGEKHEKAMALVAQAIEEDCVLTIQSLAEFYAAVTRKGYAKSGQAIELIQQWSTLFPLVVANGGCLMRAMKAVQEYQLSFWDAMLWATAKEASCSIVLSEDFQHKQTIEGVQFINPFF